MGHGEDPLRFCVGLHYGPVVLGNIGNERRLEFTVIGDTVNIAARLEALTRRLGFDLIVSEDVVTAVRREGGESALAGPIQGEAMLLRGRHGMVPIWMHHEASETPSQTIP
jgi:adenylate cyclase